MGKIKIRIKKIETIKATQSAVNIDLLWKQGKEIEKQADEVMKMIPLEALRNMFKILQPSNEELEEIKKDFGESVHLTIDAFSRFKPEHVRYERTITYNSLFYFYAFWGEKRKDILTKQIDRVSLMRFEEGFLLQIDANKIFTMRIDAIKAMRE